MASQSGWTKLHQACKEGNLDMVINLITHHGASVSARDDENDTPLHVAALFGKEEVALALINLFGCDVNMKGHYGRLALHSACNGGNVSLVTNLILNYNASVSARDDNNETPLHVAALCGNEEITLALINQFGCDVNVKGCKGRLALHSACDGGNVSLITNLILNHKASVSTRDDDSDTPLHVAALCGREEVALTLINQFGCDVNVKGYKGRLALHNACGGGNVSLVTNLIFNHGASVSARDDDNNTPLHVAALCGREEVALALINQFGCDVNVKGRNGRLALHSACIGGNVSLVTNLILNHGASVSARDDNNNIPLHVAAACGKEEVALALINKFGCDVNVKGYKGGSALHSACIGGNVSLVTNLILNHNASVSARDDENDTPLHVAALGGKEEVVLALINQFGCDINVKGRYGRLALHSACIGGNISLVTNLILNHKASVNARCDDNDTPLHEAASNGKEEVVLVLINQFGCDVYSKGKFGESCLYKACNNGQLEVIKALCEVAPLLLTTVDIIGDTPLHVCAREGHTECVKALLEILYVPVLKRDKLGFTARNVAKNQAIALAIDEYVANNKHKIKDDYSIIKKRAKRRYSKARQFNRIFIVGNPGCGKSSFVESLKREEFFQSFSQSSVPLHTTGIVPSEYTSSHFGRVLFYDFAGDAEYYSSHAAIFESLSSSSKGNDIFVIVVNLREEDTTIENHLHYWFLFILNQKLSNQNVSLILIGSHADLISEEILAVKIKIFHHFIKHIQCKVKYHQSKYFLLDCRKPRGMSDVKRFLKNLTSNSPVYSLSFEASILLGLLEKDFSNVTACHINSIISNIELAGLLLPTDPKSLCSVLHELHEMGLLLVIKGKMEDDVQVVLNISQLTSEVHELLFSQGKFGKKKLDLPSNVGLVPESLLVNALPKHITKECLIQLQYCQEISRTDLKVFSFNPQAGSTDQSYLFFPALCTKDKSVVRWNNTSYSIGWVALCRETSDYFPSRFLHVLLLRLILIFTLEAPNLDQPQSSSPEHSLFQHRCTLWKTGVQWLMEEGTEGVECMAELVNDSKGVVVITKSSDDRENIEACTNIFTRIFNCVMEAKAEFCHYITPQFFLLVSTEEADYLSEDNLVVMSDVERVLTCTEKKVVQSITGKKVLKCDQLLCMHKLTMWGSVFPIDFNSLLPLLKEIHNIPDLCMYLNVPHYVLREAEDAYPRDVSRRRMEVLWWWRRDTSQGPPCWYHIVRALKDMQKNALAKEIEMEHSQEIEMQEKLFDEKNQCLTPDVTFLEQFSEVVGSKWPSLASLLSLTGSEIEEVREEGEGLTQQHHAHLMLKKWVSKKEATYGQLYQKLKTISLFQYAN